MYTFLFDRRSMSLLLAGCAVATILIFSSGVVVGLWVSLPSAPEVIPQFAGLSDGRQLTAGEPPTVAEKSPPRLAVAPFEEPTAGSEEPAPAAPAAPAAPVAQSTAVEPRPAASKEADRYSGGVERADLYSEEVERADLYSGEEERSVRYSGEEERSVRYSEEEERSVRYSEEEERSVREDPWAPSAHPVYSVQVGTFVVESRATVFVDELRTRGWEPYIIETTFPSGRPAITVRVGSYSRLEEALKAAGSFEASENRATTVRWSDLESPSRGSEARRSS